MLHKNVNEFESKKVSAGENTEFQVLISNNIAPNFAMRKFKIKPNGFMPLHTNLVEHEQYVLKGKAEVVIGNKKIIVKKDDVVFIPANVKHSYKNISDEAFEFLCVVPNKEDKIEIIQ